MGYQLEGSAFAGHFLLLSAFCTNLSPGPLFPPPLLTPNSNPLKWWYQDKSCGGFKNVYPEEGVESWRCKGVYGKKVRYHFTAGKRPEEELKVQFAFEESLVEYYEILQQDAFESSKPGRTQRLDSRVQAGLLPLARTLAK